MPSSSVRWQGAVMPARVGRVRGGAGRRAEPVGGHAVEAEGRDQVGTGDELVGVDRRADRRRVRRSAATAVDPAGRDGVEVDLVVQDRGVEHEVGPVGDLVAAAVGEAAVLGEAAREVLAGRRAVGAGVVAERERAALTRQEVGRCRDDVGVRGLRWVGRGREARVVPEAKRVGHEVDVGRRGARQQRQTAGRPAREDGCQRARREHARVPGQGDCRRHRERSQEDGQRDGHGGERSSRAACGGPLHECTDLALRLAMLVHAHSIGRSPLER